MRRIVIVGASSGLGLELARTLASRGVPVGLAARHTKQLNALQRLYPDNVAVQKLDITHASAPEALATLIDQLGGMDIYIHVAGIGVENPELDPEVETRMLTTNVLGFARMVTAAYRYFRDADRPGRIAAVTSVAGTKGLGTMAAYSASKRFDSTYLTALEQLSHRQGVDVTFTDIRPGWTSTPLVDAKAKYPLLMSVQDVVPQIIKAIARGRRVCTIDRRWRALGALWRLVPDALWVRLPGELLDRAGHLPKG